MIRSLETPDGKKGLVEVLMATPSLAEKIKILIFSAKVKDWVTFVSALSGFMLIFLPAIDVNISNEVLLKVNAALLALIASINSITNKTE